MGKGRYAAIKKTNIVTDINTVRPDSGVTPVKCVAVDGFVKLIIIVVILLIGLTIRSNVVERVIVNGDSMSHTFKQGGVLLAKKYDLDSFERFDIVVVSVENKNMLKRIIGLPNETVSILDGAVYVNGTLLSGDYGDYIHRSGVATGEGITLGDRDYFVLGDNRNNSKDSRYYGAVDVDYITGKIVFQVFPFSGFGLIDSGENKEVGG